MILIIGNGKSLRHVDLERIADKPKFCFNRFYLADVSWKPTHYTIADEAIMQDYEQDIRAYIKDVPIGYGVMYLLGVDMDYIIPPDAVTKNGRDYYSHSPDPNHSLGTVNLTHWITFSVQQYNRTILHHLASNNKQQSTHKYN